MNCVLGIDPGKSGYLSVVKCVDGVNVVISSIEMPTIKPKTGKQEYLPNDIRDFIESGVKNHGVQLVLIERQQVMTIQRDKGFGQAQGAVSSGATMYGYGLLVGICVGLKVPYTTVHPRTWQSAILRDVPGSDSKVRSVLKASTLYPSVDLRRTPKCKKPSDGKADSLNLCWWGLHKFVDDCDAQA